MELVIKDKSENPALQRTEITGEVSYDKAVPSRKEIREALCAAAGADPACTVIISVKSSFGSRHAVVLAHAYRSKEGLSAEHRYLLVRDGLAEKKKKEAKQKAAPAKK